MLVSAAVKDTRVFFVFAFVHLKGNFKTLVSTIRINLMLPREDDIVLYFGHQAHFCFLKVSHQVTRLNKV